MFSRCPVDVIARAFVVVLSASEVTVPSEIGPAAHAHQEAFNAEGSSFFALVHPFLEVVYVHLDLPRRCDISCRRNRRASGNDFTEAPRQYGPLAHVVVHQGVGLGRHMEPTHTHTHVTYSWGK